MGERSTVLLCCYSLSLYGLNNECGVRSHPDILLAVFVFFSERPGAIMRSFG